MKLLLLIFFSLISFFSDKEGEKNKTKPVKIKPLSFHIIHVPEPSDICVHPFDNSFFVVSDNGFLFQVDSSGNVIRKADYLGYDCEGVYADEKHVYVVEEMTRKIKLFDIDSLNLLRTVYLSYAGGRNKAYESFTFNKAKNRFIIITEKDPIYLFELDENLSVIQEINLGKIAGDISAATFYENHIWLLSDEDMQVMKLDPMSYEVLNRWAIPVVNPEGIAFNKKGQMIIVSDDMERMYIFNHPEKNEN